MDDSCQFEDVTRPRCAVCRDPAGEAPLVQCPRCGTGVHTECWSYLGACPVYGCVPREVPRAEPLTGGFNPWAQWVRLHRIGVRLLRADHYVLWLAALATLATTAYALAIVRVVLNAIRHD